MRPTQGQLRTLSGSDPALAKAIKQVPPFPTFPTPATRRLSHFAYLAKAITFQQLAGAAAATIWGRVCALAPGPLPPTAKELLRLPDRKLRAAGLSRNKMLSLQDLAQRVEDRRLRLRSVARRPDEEVVEELVEVRGIGPWTAQMFLIFKLGRLDVLPTGDLGVQEGMRILDGLHQRPTPRDLEARGAVWAPLRSVASWTLWRIADTPMPGQEPT